MVSYPSTKSIGAEKLNQLAYNNDAKAIKKMDVLAMPFKVVTDTNTAAVLVGKGNLCRVFGTATTDVVTFGPSTVSAPTTSTQTAALLSQACQIFVATDDYIRTTAGVSRVEMYLD